MKPTEQQRRDDAGLRLVGRGLLEGLLAGAALGPAVLLLIALGAVADNPVGGVRGDDLAVAVVFGFYAAVFAAPFGLVGSVLALVVLGLVTRWRRGVWTTTPLTWFAPGLAVGVATATIGVVGDESWWFYLAAVPAAGLTAWRVRRAVARYATETVDS